MRDQSHDPPQPGPEGRARDGSDRDRREGGARGSGAERHERLRGSAERPRSDDGAHDDVRDERQDERPIGLDEDVVGPVRRALRARRERDRQR